MLELDRLLSGIAEAVNPIEAIETIDQLLEELTGRVEKARGKWDLTTEDGFSEAVLSIALRMRGDERDKIQNWVRPFRAALKQNWPELTAAESKAAIAEVGSLISDLGTQVANGQALVLDQFSQRIVEDTKASAIDRYGLGIAPSFTRADEVAQNQIMNSTVNFIRDREGAIHDKYSLRARNYIAFTAAQRGLGREEIARNLESLFLDMRKPSYWDFVANHFVNRSRAMSSLNAYAQANVTVYRIVAVLDERTTDTCRFLDGQIFDVQSSIDLVNNAEKQAADAGDVNLIKEFNPFVWTSGDGKTLTTMPPSGNQARIADIVRSGVGNVGDRGEFAKGLDPKQMNERGVGPPPYHAFCRTTIVPEFQDQPIPTAAQPAAEVPPTAPGKVTPETAKSLEELAAKGVWTPEMMELSGNVKGAPSSARERAGVLYEGFRERGNAQIGDLLKRWERTERLPLAVQATERQALQKEMAERFQSIGRRTTGDTKAAYKKRSSAFVDTMNKKTGTKRGLPKADKAALERAHGAFGPLAENASSRVDTIRQRKGRAYWSAGRGLIQKNNARSLAHEFSHVIEYEAGIPAKAEGFLAQRRIADNNSFWTKFREFRRAGEAPRRLRDDTGLAYSFSEIYVRDRFIGLDPYTSKVYSDGATEFVSMLGEKFLTDPEELGKTLNLDLEKALDGSPDVIAAFFGWVQAAVEGAMEK